MSFKEKWNRMNRKADQAIKNARARKTAQPDTDNTGRKEKKPGGHKVLRAIAAVCLVGIMLMCVAGCVLTVWAFDTLNTDQQMLDLSMQKAKYTTIFYADDGVTELARAYDPEAGNRIWVDYDQMPKCLLDATVAVEDKRFWEHNGVDFLTTQMFFDNTVFYNFREMCAIKGIDVPLIAGIMPITKASQLERTVKLSGCSLPTKFVKIVERFGDRDDAMQQAGIVYAAEQIIDLMANGVDHIHIYTMNKPDVAGAIVRELGSIIHE